MEILRKMNLRPRLAVAFGSIALALLLVGGVGLMRLAQMNRSMQAISDNLYPKVRAAHEIGYLVLDEARAVRNMILLSDDKDVAKNREIVAADAALIRTNLDQTQRLVNSEKGNALFGEMKQASDAYQAFTDDVAALATRGQKTEATALLYSERYAVQGRLIAAVKAMSAFQESRMTDGKTAAEQLFETSSVTIGSVCALAVVFCIAAAWAISRSICLPLRDAVAVAEAVAGGDLTTCAVSNSNDEVGRLLKALGAMNASLASIVGQVRQGSDSIATGSGQIASGNADLSQRTEEQASNLQQTAASMEELSSTVRSNDETARQATQIAASAAAVARRGGEVMGEVVGTMEAITTSSRRIADIIGVIDGIAFQTNILALNAAVEAARAGEQGRGFAVVASEVRSLAQRSAGAAKEIKGLITDSVEKVDAGRLQVAEAGRTIDSVVVEVARVNDLIGEIGSATREQTQGIGQVSDAVNELDKVTQQNAALVEESAAAAESLKQQANRLVDAVGRFRLTA